MLHILYIYVIICKVTYSVRAQNILKYYLTIYGESVSYSKFCCYLVAKSCPTFLTPWTVVRQTPSVNGIFQARIMEWIAISFSWDIPNPGIESSSPALQEDSLPISHQRSPASKLSCWFSSCTMNVTRL